MSAPAAGGRARTLATGFYSPSNLAVGSTDAYFASTVCDENAIMKLPLR
jgi:hypothetical protein